jgi:hypothetical protein
MKDEQLNKNDEWRIKKKTHKESIPKMTK